jgi:hypothetical protein
VAAIGAATGQTYAGSLKNRLILSIPEFSGVVLMQRCRLVSSDATHRSTSAQTEPSMRYMMLIYTREGDLSKMSPEEAQKIRETHAAVMHETRERGMLVAVNGLGKTNTATTVRVESGKVLATDGPFAETKEQLAGYYVLDCVDLNEAIYWAGRIPSSCGGAKGSVEIRQLVEFQGVPESMLKPHRVAVASAAN